MTITFDELAGERNRESILAEAAAFADMLREALLSSLDAPDPEAAMGESLAQFTAATDEAIPLWATGKTSLSKSTVLERCRTARDGIAKVLEDAGEGVPETPTRKEESPMEATKEMLKTRSAVVAAIGVKAEEIAKRDQVGPGVARMRAWRELAHLAERYEELPPEAPAPAKPETPVRKAGAAMQEATAQARELMKGNPGKYKGLSSARLDVYRADPALAERVRAEQERGA